MLGLTATGLFVSLSGCTGDGDDSNGSDGEGDGDESQDGTDGDTGDADNQQEGTGEGEDSSESDDGSDTDDGDDETGDDSEDGDGGGDGGDSEEGPDGGHGEDDGDDEDYEGPEGAIKQYIAHLEAGDVESAREMIHEVPPFEPEDWGDLSIFTDGEVTITQIEEFDRGPEDNNWFEVIVDIETDGKIDQYLLEFNLLEQDGRWWVWIVAGGKY